MTGKRTESQAGASESQERSSKPSAPIGLTQGSAAGSRGAEHTGAEEPMDFDEIIHTAETFVREQMSSRPYQTVLAAAGVGYLLGRGLVSPFGRMILLGAGRMALMNAWQSGDLKSGINRMIHPNA